MDYENMASDKVNEHVAQSIEIDRITGASVESKDADYCNNWGDAGQLILKRGITLIQLQSGKWAAISRFTLDEKGNPVRRYHHTDENPLRAAMIVYLQSSQNLQHNP